MYNTNKTNWQRKVRSQNRFVEIYLYHLFVSFSWNFLYKDIETMLQYNKLFFALRWWYFIELFIWYKLVKYLLVMFRFTSLVEKHLPEMCICLRDQNLQVRENTLTLMIQLIQEDYLKLRSPMFFHLMTTLVDQEPMIRDMTSSFVINSLVAKQKNILIKHFVEGLFHFNVYLVCLICLF